MLGMGDSTKIAHYHHPIVYTIASGWIYGTVPPNINEPEDPKNPVYHAGWDWKNHALLIQAILTAKYSNRRIYFYSDDWGGGIGIHLAALMDKQLAGSLLLDPVALSGYPVAEIQAIGRATGLSVDDGKYQMAMGAFDQTAIQIMKTMMHKPDDYFNQWTYRIVLWPYVRMDYENVDLKGTTGLYLKMGHIRCLSEQSSVLGSHQLLPVSGKVPKGVNYEAITHPVAIQWGEYDNMMPNSQLYDLEQLLVNASRVDLYKIPQAGHFAAMDNPKWAAEINLEFVRKCEAKHLNIPQGHTLSYPFYGFDTIFAGHAKKRLQAYYDTRPINPNIYYSSKKRINFDKYSK